MSLLKFQKLALRKIDEVIQQILYSPRQKKLWPKYTPKSATKHTFFSIKLPDGFTAHADDTIVHHGNLRRIKYLILPLPLLPQMEESRDMHTQDGFLANALQRWFRLSGEHLSYVG